MSSPIVALVGLPGSGKSTAGRQLARRLGLPFFDVDAEIEAELGQSIRHFFEQQGEAAFRAVEEAVLDRLTISLREEGGGVLATGGGAVLRQSNRERLRERAVVLYLRATPGQLHKRLAQDTKRPLLQVADPLKKLQELHAVRDPLYRECAHFVVDTNGLSVSMLTRRLLMQLELAAPAFTSQH